MTIAVAQTESNTIATERITRATPTPKTSQSPFAAVVPLPLEDLVVHGIAGRHRDGAHERVVGALRQLVGPAEVVAQDPDVLLVLPADVAQRLPLLDDREVADPDGGADRIRYQRLAQLFERALAGARRLEVHLDFLARDLEPLGADGPAHLARHRRGQIPRGEAVARERLAIRQQHDGERLLLAPEAAGVDVHVADARDPFQPGLEIERQPLDARERIAQDLDPERDAPAAAVPELKPGPLPRTDTLAPPISTARWVSSSSIS